MCFVQISLWERWIKKDKNSSSQTNTVPLSCCGCCNKISAAFSRINQDERKLNSFGLWHGKVPFHLLFLFFFFLSRCVFVLTPPVAACSGSSVCLCVLSSATAIHKRRRFYIYIHKAIAGHAKKSEWMDVAISSHIATCGCAVSKGARAIKCDRRRLALLDQNLTKFAILHHTAQQQQRHAFVCRAGSGKVSGERNVTHLC